MADDERSLDARMEHHPKARVPAPAPDLAVGLSMKAATACPAGRLQASLIGGAGNGINWFSGILRDPMNLVAATSRTCRGAAGTSNPATVKSPNLVLSSRHNEGFPRRKARKTAYILALLLHLTDSFVLALTVASVHIVAIEHALAYSETARYHDADTRRLQRAI